MKTTQNEMVLRMLIANRDGITSMDALRELGVARLAARINDLRKEGHWIDAMAVRKQTRNGWAWVACYRLINKKGDAI